MFAHPRPFEPDLDDASVGKWDTIPFEANLFECASTLYEGWAFLLFRMRKTNPGTNIENRRG